MSWEPAERVQKNESGEYRALIGGQWVPVLKAQKSESGEFRVERTTPPPQAEQGGPFGLNIKPDPNSDRRKSVVQNAARQTIVGIPDAVINTPHNLWNLSKMGVGLGMSAAGVDPERWPDVSTQPPNVLQKASNAVGFTSPENEPKTRGERLLAGGTQGAVGMALPSGNPINYLVGGTAGLVGQGTKEATGSDVAAIAAQLAAPTAIRGGGRALRSTAEGTMQRAVQPSLPDLNRGDKVPRTIDTLLQEKVGPTSGGISKLRKQAEQLRVDTDARLARSTETVPKSSTGGVVVDEINKLEQRHPMPAVLRNEMEKVYNEFVSNPLTPSNIPVSQANVFKRTLQQDLKNKYGTMTEGNDTAKRALAAELRRSIEKKVPEVAPINARASELWNAINVAERKALQSHNQQLMGIGVLANRPELSAAYYAQRNPWVLSHLANLLNPGKQITKPTSEAGRLMMIELLMRQQGTEEQP